MTDCPICGEYEFLSFGIPCLNCMCSSSTSPEILREEKRLIRRLING